MSKTCLFCSLLLVTTTSLASADIYRCKDADGTFIFTDNPSNAPQGCQVDVVSDLPYNDVSPSNPSPPVKQGVTTQRPASTTKQTQQETVENTYASLKEEAGSLVEQFVSTRSKAFRSTKVKNKQKARRLLTEIRTQKVSLLSEVDQSTLNRSQKKEVREILTKITDK